ncbi:MAG: Uma2 family endonuclease [Planctomycetota bacterium]
MSTRLLLTVAEYGRIGEAGGFDSLGRRIELIDGEIHEMSPVGPIHSDFIDYLSSWSIRVAEPAGMRVRIQSDIVLSDSTQPVPDVTWMNGRRYLDRLPLPSDVRLIIEVADSSLSFDLGTKADRYADAGVAELWVVDVTHRCLHAMSDPLGGTYTQRRRFEPPQQPAPLCLPTAKLDLADLFDEPEA